MNHTPCDNTSCNRSINVGQTGSSCVLCASDDTILCGQGFTDELGIITTINGTVFNFQAPNGISIDSAAVQRAVNRFNQQLPTGSLQGYILSLLDDLSSTLYNNASSVLGIVLGTVFMTVFILFAVICILMIAYGIMDPAIGITLIFIGLFISAIGLIICYSEAYSLSMGLEPTLFNNIDPVMNILSCAFTSGLCCYIGGTCCCPGGSNTTCGS